MRISTFIYIHTEIIFDFISIWCKNLIETSNLLFKTNKNWQMYDFAYINTD